MRRGFVLLTAGAMVASGAVGTAAAAPGLDWNACKPGSAVECATLTVPVDWDRPGDTIGVAVARIKATGHRTGTLVYMPGGPGDSGVDRLLGGDVVPPAVAEHYDVVSYDPRGTNRSNPVVCSTALLGALPNAVPEAGARLSDVQAFARRLGDDCRANTGPLVDHVDNVSVARDIDALRAAVGAREVTLYGRSYGTLAGQMYAENFPHRVRGLVLDSVFDHSLTPARFMASQAATAEDSFTEFAQWCAGDPACALHGQDVGQVYDDLWDRAVRGELPMSPLDLANRVTRFFYDPDWAGAAEWLASAGAARTAAAEETAPFPIAAFCGDHRVRISSQGEWLSMWRKQNAAAPTVHAHLSWLVVSLCSAWPGETPNPQHRTDIDRSVPPVLVLNSRHDPATSIAWARSVHRQIDRSALLTYDGWGHGVMDRTDCTRAVFTDYVLTGKTPRPDTHCPAATIGG